jgi:two-component system NtrC family sensor kinase
MLLVGVAGLLIQPAAPPAGNVVMGFVLYALAGAVIGMLLIVAEDQISPRVARSLVVASMITDALFAAFLIFVDTGISSEFYLLFCFLAFKATIFYVSAREIMVLPYLFGPLYIATLYLRTESLYFLLDRDFLLRFFLLFAVVLAATYTAWMMDIRQRRITRLSVSLGQKSEDLEKKTAILQKTATELGDRLVQLRSLQEGMKVINSAISLNEVLDLIVANASQVLDGVRCSIGLVSDDRKRVTIGAASGGNWNLDDDEFTVDQEVSVRVVRSGRPVLIPDLSAEGSVRSSKIPVTSVMCVPLIAEGEVLGALCATSADRQVFSEEQVTLLSAFADQAAMAVRNARLYERLGQEKGEAERGLRQIMAVHEVARALVSTLNLEETLNLIIERLISLAESSHCAVTLLDDEGENLVGRIVRGVAIDQRKVFRINLKRERASARAVRLRTSVVVDDALHSPVAAQQRLAEIWGIRTYLVTPLVSRERVIGAIYLGDARLDFRFGEREIQLTTSFAHFAATAIENARLYQDLREKSNELEAVVQGIGDGVIVTDLNLGLLMVNPIASHIFGIGSAALPGLPLPEVINHDGLVEVIRDTSQGTGQPVIREIEIATGRADEKRTYQALAAPVLGEAGQPRGVVTVLRDITSQKEVERLKSNFLSVVSHELKTPLHSIKGFVDIILMGKTGEVNDLQRDFLTTVREQTEQLQNLINDLLEFSRLESGEMRIHPERISVSDLVKRVVDKFTPLADKEEIHLQSMLPDSFPHVDADPFRLEQVVSNLVDNALKFTPPGGTVILSGKDLGDEVQISVHDTGIGIPLSEQARIFDRFYQVDASATRAYSGTGLGLTICKHIIEQHHGRIWVESDGEKSSTFSFTLPKRLPDEEDLALDFSTLDLAP